MGGEAEVKFGNQRVRITQETNYPWDGKINIKLITEQASDFTIALRIPGWCKTASLVLNSTNVNIEENLKDRYVHVKRAWRNEATIQLQLDMPVEGMEANPLVRADTGKVAIQRGPLVYCLEEVDYGANLSAVKLDIDKELTAAFEETLLGGSVVIKGSGTRTQEDSWNNQLYRSFKKEDKPVKLIAIPYFLWGNREPGEMTVWIRHK